MSRAARKLEQWVRMQAATAPGGTLLPTDADLAKRWALSPRTIRRVMKGVEADGGIVRVRGSGTYVRERPAPLPRNRPHSSAALVCNHFRRLIHLGKIKRGRPLPPIKEICHQFSVTSSTVSRAYRALEQDELVTRIGKRFYIGSPDRLEPKPSRPLVMVYNVSGTRFTDMLRESELQLDAYRYMERELLACGYRVHSVAQAELQDLIARNLAPENTPSAILVSYVPTRHYERFMSSIHKLIHPRRDMLKFLLITGAHNRPPAGVLQLCSGNLTTIRARRFALFARDKGYRRVSFFQHYETPRMPLLMHNIKIAREFLYYCREAQLRMHLHFSSQIGDYRHRLHNTFRELGTQYLTSFFSKYEPRTPSEIINMCSMSNAAALPFENHLGSDLWLFERQDDAVTGLDWLAAHGLRVPKDLHVASLDDRAEHFGRGITCCGYDWQSTGYLMAHALIGDIPVARTRHGFLRTEGIIIERQSTEGVG